MVTTLKPLMVITGASRGIGASVARLASQRGWNLALNYRGDGALAERLARDCSRAGAEVEIFSADVSHHEQVEAMFEAVLRRFGRIDALVNSAGITGKQSRFIEAQASTLREVLSVNITVMPTSIRAASRSVHPSSSDEVESGCRAPTTRPTWRLSCSRYTNRENTPVGLRHPSAVSTVVRRMSSMYVV